MTTFLVTYAALGLVALFAVAALESTRKGPQDFTFVVSIAMQWPVSMLPLLVLWPLVVVVAAIILFSSDRLPLKEWMKKRRHHETK